MQVKDDSLGVFDRGMYQYPTLYKIKKVNNKVGFWKLIFGAIDKKKYDEEKKIQFIPLKREHVLDPYMKTLYGCYYTVYGDHKESASQQISSYTVIEKGVHEGNSNETTILQQTLLTCNSLYQDKIKNGMTTSYPNVNQASVFPIEEGVFAMLLHNYRKFSSRVMFPAWISEKMNGDRVLIDIDPQSKSYRIYSRMRKTRLGINFMNFECTMLMTCLKGRVIFDCEAYAADKPLNVITGLVTNSSNNIQLPLNCFDAFIPSDPEMKFEQRYYMICSIIKSMSKLAQEDNRFAKVIDELKAKYPLFKLGDNVFGHLSITQYIKVKHYSEIEALFNKFVEGGSEGIVVRNLHGVYETGPTQLRSYDTLKLKPIEDKEYKIVGFHEAGKGKFAGSIAFKCTTKGGIVFNPQLKGWSMSQRQLEYKKCMADQAYFDNTYGNKYAKIQYSEVRENDVPQQPFIIAFVPASELDNN
jgi:hypothetical protein